jgi:hypothetical protein
VSKRAGVALILGIAMLAVAGWVWHHAQPAPNVGVAEVRALAGTSAPSVSTAAPVVPTQAATLPAAVETDRPVRVRVDRLHISAVVVPTGVDATGAFAVPPSVSTVGWYRFGPGLGASAGSTVIAGHVDSATQGTGAFAQLRHLTEGDRVDVTGSDGRTQTFTVVGREEYPKSTIDLDRYFATTGAPRLTLITCGGPFNRSTGHYRDNVVVTAVPGPTSKGSS